LATKPHFVRKGCVGRWATRNFTPVFGDRTSFRAKGLRPDALPRAFKREIEKKERARGQESQRAREQEGKREREDMKM